MSSLFRRISSFYRFPNCSSAPMSLVPCSSSKSLDGLDGLIWWCSFARSTRKYEVTEPFLEEDISKNLHLAYVVESSSVWMKRLNNNATKSSPITATPARDEERKLIEALIFQLYWQVVLFCWVRNYKFVYLSFYPIGYHVMSAKLPRNFHK